MQCQSLRRAGTAQAFQQSAAFARIRNPRMAFDLRPQRARQHQRHFSDIALT
jgi:hypothetical protein